ncbi:MAG: tetratricopeptide repeat protein, partial [Candidatus Kapabacteria bacterium]|nr:tetratricopeptide repeat protein [Candidatus Kapabacteria bacterium]
AEKSNDEALRTSISNIKFSTWAEMYNTSVEIFNRYMETNDANKLDKGIETLNNAIVLKPELPENYSLLGMLQESKGDTAAAIQSYEKYASMQSKAIALAKEKGIYLNMLRDKATDVLGQPYSSKNTKSMSGDSMMVEAIRTGSDTVYLYSVQKDKTGAVVEGWRVSPPATWTLSEKERYASLNLRPYNQLGTLYYNKKNYDKALQYIDVISTLRPADEQAQNLKVQIYQDQGKLDEALASLAELVRNDPKNKIFIANYAQALLRQERYDDAIAQYEKAMQIDADYDVALYNCAAALKNRAAIVQREEREKRDKDPKYKENELRYFPLLTKSAEYFDRYRRLPSHKDDLTAIEHMVNIYETVREKAKLKQTITEIETLEFSNSKNPRYWDILGGVYARGNQTDRADKAFKKADELRRAAKQ